MKMMCMNVLVCRYCLDEIAAHAYEANTATE